MNHDEVEYRKRLEALAFVQPLHNAAGQLDGIPIDDLPRDLSVEINFLCTKLRRLVPIMERVLRGKVYKCCCRGCEVQSSFPLGSYAPNLCGPCWNGSCDHPGHANHEENKRRGAEEIG